ncbi:MAG TPA: retropepsin-like aspartic protease [Vicinamibacteria bacterium]|nr:retropepsin-like aspartic protease [Vicinamibacteria bacterium]
MTLHHRSGLLVALTLLLASPLPAADPVAELPLEFEKNLPLATLRVKDTPLVFVLDSAAAGCVLDGEKAAEMGITATDSALNSGSGGTIAVGLAHGVRLRLGGLEVVPDYTVLTPLHGLGFRKAVQGILGFPLFGKYVVEIDYAARQARIFDPERHQPAPGTEAVPLWMADGPTVRGRLKLAGAEEIEADFQLDTGSSHVLTICKAFVDRHRMLERVPGLVLGETVGIGGASPDRVGRIASVAVGRFSIDAPEVRFATGEGGSFESHRFEANLGNGFLARHLVTFDIPHGRLLLREP